MGISDKVETYRGRLAQKYITDDLEDETKSQRRVTIDMGMEMLLWVMADSTSEIEKAIAENKRKIKMFMAVGSGILSAVAAIAVSFLTR